MDLRLSDDARRLLESIDPRRREQVAGTAARSGSRQIQPAHVNIAARQT